MRKQTLLLTVFFLLIGLMTSTTWAQANGTITGFVYAPNGTTPLANAVVTLYPYYGVSTSVTTNALGIYTAEVAADAYRLKVEPVGYPWEYYGNTTDWYATPYVTLAAGATVGAIDFVVDAPASISGTVYAPDGTTPLSGVTVNMYFQTSGFWYAGTALTTNASGQYTAYVRPGTYTVNVRPLNYPAEYWDNQISLSSAASFAVNNGDTITGKNFTLDNGGFISGTIYEPNGVLPLAGATVSLYNDTGSLWLSSVLSDASGQYTIPARAGSFRIGVSKNGYNFQISLSSISVTAGATTSSVNFTLGATASISGTVTTGAPLVAQPISAYIADLGAPVIPDQTAVVASGEVAPVELDDAGEPILEGEQPERIETIVSPGAPDVLDIERANLVQQGVLTEEIVYGFVEVFNATTGATVTTAPLNAVGAYTAYLALSENSNFRVRGNVAGYVREYYGGKFQASQADAVAVAVGQQVTGIDIQLEAAGTITGTIFGSGGVPLAGRFVDWLLNGYDNKTTCTDSSGNYQLTGVPLNAGVRVRAWGPYSCSGTATNLYTQYWTTSTTFAGGTAITLTPGSPTIGGVNFTLQTGGIVTGTITNAFTGAPIVGGTITAFDPATANFLNNTGSNSSGAYTLLGIRPGNTWFRGTALSYIEEYYNNKTTQLNADQVAVTTGGTVPNINFTLDPTTGIRGTVYAPNGTTTVAGATVIAYDANGTLRGSTTTNGSGFYQLYAGAGSFKLEVRSSSYPTEFYADQLTFATANSVNVSTNEFTENINFTLDEGGVITGRVTEADGTTPIANVNLDTYEQVGGVIYTATTDASGNYRIPVRPGAYRVRAWEPGYVIEYYAGVLKAADA
ncbi:MAG: carboxypeptidase regulatory-like domain-containing protein, partial [Anaerolinea sp.]|nr:carboxypeptidase regulatory-like domain-containing protein [Anaerolinea sp.]